MRGDQQLLTPSPSFHKEATQWRYREKSELKRTELDTTAKSRGGGEFRSIWAFKPYGNVGLVKRDVITQTATMLR